MRAHFPTTLLLAREPVAWGADRTVLTPENLARARNLSEAWDEDAADLRRRPRQPTRAAHDHGMRTARAPTTIITRTRRDRSVRTALAPFVEFGFMRRALVGCLALSVSAPPVGVFLMLRRMSLMSDAMSHAILPGAAAGFLVAGLSLPAMTLGGLVAGLAVALLAGARHPLHGGARGCEPRGLLPDLARRRRAAGLAARLADRPAAHPVRHGAGPRRRRRCCCSAASATLTLVGARR